MKKILCLFICLLSFVSMYAQKVNFEFSDGIDDGPLKTKMEQQVASLLTAINAANTSGGDVNFTGIDVTDDASASLTMTWEQVHFAIEDDDIVDHCIGLPGKSGGYRVQNIGVLMNKSGIKDHLPIKLAFCSMTLALILASFSLPPTILLLAPI